MSSMKAQEIVTVEETSPFKEYPELVDEGMLARERSHLLGLPPEILQHVLFHMDTGAFFTILLSCKIVFGAAHAKHVLLHHLGRMPGLRLGLRDLDSKALFAIFRKRAAKGLYGAGVLADVTRYAECDDSTGMGRYALIPGKPTHLATAHEHGQVRIYELTEKYVRQQAELRTEEQWDKDLGRNYHMEVLKMAFSSDRDLAVLCRPKLPKVEPTPFADDSMLPLPGDKPRHILKLVTFHRCHAKTKGYFYSSAEQETRDIAFSPNHEPVGLALASKGNACITWRSPDNQEVTEIVLYGRDSKLMLAENYDPNPTALIYTDPPARNNDVVPKRQIFQPSFSVSDRVLNFHSPGSPIHAWYTNSTSPSSSTSGPIHSNLAYVTLDPSDALAQPFQIGIPFNGTHTASITVSYSTAPMCRCSYLALGECTSSDAHDGGGNVFILQAETDTTPTSCNHKVDLDQGRRNSTWKPLALLAGWRHGTSSLGTVVAVSGKATHVAAADWDCVLVWSLDPAMLHQGGLEHWFPKVDFNKRKDLGRLRPVKLRSQGVVYGMVWVGETSLYGVTERGLVRWDVGPLAEGGSEELALQYDAWKETAVAMGMPGSSSRR